MANTNTLKDIKCPQCGFDTCFNITATAQVQVSDKGVTDAHTFEWDSSSACSCGKCDFSGEFSEFYEANAPAATNGEGVLGTP